MYYKNIKTNEIAFFGGIPDEDWIEATLDEISANELKRVKKIKITQCQAYLQQTSWQVERLCDPSSGKPLKDGVAEKRALARSLQDEINTCTTLEELNNININFN